jgi:hypothetical protein
MAETIATVDELQARLDWTLDDGERGVAQGALDDLSEDARYYGATTWDSVTAPRQIKSLVLRAAARYMRNPDGYVQSRAGDETLMWTDKGDQLGNAQFNVQEQKMLATIAGRTTSGLYSVPITAWGTRPQPQEISVPADGSMFAGTPQSIPFYGENDPFGPY